MGVGSAFVPVETALIFLSVEPLKSHIVYMYRIQHEFLHQAQAGPALWHDKKKVFQTKTEAVSPPECKENF